jgi:hypothetical protein
MMGRRIVSDWDGIIFTDICGVFAAIAQGNSKLKKQDRPSFKLNSSQIVYMSTAARYLQVANL